MAKNLVYDKDHVLNKIKDLENRVLILEGKLPIHEKFCSACEGSGKIICYLGRGNDYEDVCTHCKGLGK